MLSIEIRFHSKSGIDTRTVATLETHDAVISGLLSQLPDLTALHELDEPTFERLLGADDSPGHRLWRYLRGDRFRGERADEDEPQLRPGIPRVATAKLLSRKRPHLLPVVDSVTDTHLFGGRNDRQWSGWWLALSRDDSLVAALRVVRDETAGAEHLSILRVADIITWQRNH